VGKRGRGKALSDDLVNSDSGELEYELEYECGVRGAKRRTVMGGIAGAMQGIGVGVNLTSGEASVAVC